MILSFGNNGNGGYVSPTVNVFQSYPAGFESYEPPGDTYWTYNYNFDTYRLEDSPFGDKRFPVHPKRVEVDPPPSSTYLDALQEHDSYRWSGILPNVLTKYDTSGAEAWTLNLQTTINDRAKAVDYALAKDGTAYISTESMATIPSGHPDTNNHLPLGEYMATAPYAQTGPQWRGEIHKIPSNGTPVTGNWPFKHMYRRTNFDQWGLVGAWATVDGLFQHIPFEDELTEIKMDGTEEHPFHLRTDYHIPTAVYFATERWGGPTSWLRASQYLWVQPRAFAPSADTDNVGQVFVNEYSSALDTGRHIKRYMHCDPSGNLWIVHSDYGYAPERISGSDTAGTDRLSLIESESAEIIDTVQLSDFDPDNNDREYVTDEGKSIFYERLTSWGFYADNSFWGPLAYDSHKNVVGFKYDSGSVMPPERFLAGFETGFLYTTYGHPFMTG